MNRVRLIATLVERSALRYTPAGLPVAELGLRHDGEVVEAGGARRVEFECAAVAVGEIAGRLDREALGARLEIDGFLALRSRRSTRLRIHITDYRQVSGD